MNTKHTPGPWVIDEHADLVTENNDPIAFVYNLRPEYFKNVEVIAAAPDLLEACQDALDYFKVVFGEDIDIILTDKLRNAIQKAGAE